MGCGSWTRDSYVSYSTTKGMSVSTDGMIRGSYSNQDMFKAKTIDSALNPKNVIRECCDTEEHPNTIPVILALDVTGSMGESAVEVAKKLNVIMTKLYEKVTDVEFLIMGIGDLACDSCPIQASQLSRIFVLLNSLIRFILSLAVVETVMNPTQQRGISVLVTQSLIV